MKESNKEFMNVCMPLNGYIVIDGQYTMVFRFIEGRHKLKINDTAVNELTSLLYNLHKSSNLRRNIDKVTIVDKLNVYYNYFKEKSSTGVADELCEEYEKLLMSQKNIFSDMRVLHGDLSVTNILWKGSKISGVLDFDEAIYGPELYDFVVLAIKFCKQRRQIDYALWNKFLKSYKQYKNIETEEVIAMVRFYLIKVILEKLYLADIGIIDLKTSRQMRDDWQGWYKILKEECLLWKEIGTDTLETMEYVTTEIMIAC